MTLRVVNAGEILQRLAGAKVQHGRKQEGPRYRGHARDFRDVPKSISYSTIFQYESLRITLPLRNV